MKSNRPDAHNERGAVLVLVAGSIIALMLVGALAIDFSYWIVHKRQLQNAAEAGALAGAAYMPDSAKAKSQAKAVVKKNGFNTGVTVNTIGSDTVEVIISDPNTSTFLSAISLGRVITTSGHAKAAVGKPIAMGSPSNHFGTHAMLSGASAENFWAAINGACWAKANGDQISASVDYNAISPDSLKLPSDPTPGMPSNNAYYGCRPGLSNYNGIWKNSRGIDHPRIERNKSFSPDGYYYIIDIPKGHGDISVDLYDPAYSGIDPSYVSAGSNYCNDANKKSYACETPQTKCDATTAPPSVGEVADILGNTCVSGTWNGNFLTHFKTRFALYEPTGTPSNPIGGVKVKEFTYETGDSPRNPKVLSTALGATTWDEFYTIPSSKYPDGGLYVLQVRTDKDDFNATPTAYDRQSLASNNFSILAQDSGASSLTDCNSITSSTCSHVFAYQHMGVQVAQQSGQLGSPAEFYIANLPADYAGRSIELDIYDPAEKMKSLEILVPSGSNNWVSMPGSWSPTYAEGSNGIADDCQPTSPAPCNVWIPKAPLLVDVSGFQIASPNSNPPRPVSPNDSGDGRKYNRKILKFKFTLPSTYSPDPVNGWFKARYVASDGELVNDRTTWSLRTVGAPVHLIE